MRRRRRRRRRAGITALHAAVQKEGHLDVVVALLENGANVDAATAKAPARPRAGRCAARGGALPALAPIHSCAGGLRVRSCRRFRSVALRARTGVPLTRRSVWVVCLRPHLCLCVRVSVCPCLSTGGQDTATCR